MEISGERKRNVRKTAGGWHWWRRLLAREVAWAAGALLVATFAGCTYFQEQPEIEPDRFAPPASDRSWMEARSLRKEYAVPPAPQSLGARVAVIPSPANPPMPIGERQSLATLIDISLTNNPETRRNWENARAAAAAYGASRAPYYPLINVGSDAGYQRILFEFTSRTVAIQQWQVEPMINLTYTLADFGRRSAEAEIARQQLAASNFAFNRVMQNVVFGVQQSFYALAGAKAAVQAAQQNVELARTDLEAVQQRLDLGLATQPALLLARERKAQAEF
jgi:outer membrane protein TolC